MVVNQDTFPFVVIGNKCDLGEESRAVDKEQAEQFVKNLGPDIEYIETSAKENTNVSIAFEKLAEKAFNRQMEMQSKIDQNNSTTRALERERLR